MATIRFTDKNKKSQKEQLAKKIKRDRIIFKALVILNLIQFVIILTNII